MSFGKRPISFEGHRKLLEEIDRIVRTERPSVVKEIEIAIGHGDLSENAEYTYAKEKLALIDSRLRDLQERFNASEIIDLSNRIVGDKVVFGSTVLIEDMDSNERKKLRILGQDETDISQGIISIDSPVGKALIGRELNDIVEVRTPNGLREYEIVEIS